MPQLINRRSHTATVIIYFFLKHWGFSVKCSSGNSIQLFPGSVRRCFFCHVCPSSISPCARWVTLNPFLCHISCAPSPPEVRWKYASTLPHASSLKKKPTRTPTSPKVNCFLFFFSLEFSPIMCSDISKRPSPASPNYFYRACRDSSRVVKSLQSRDRDRTEVCVHVWARVCVCSQEGGGGSLLRIFFFFLLLAML